MSIRALGLTFCWIVGLSGCQTTKDFFRGHPQLQNLTLAGYQGWFGTPQDAVGGGWRHWSSKQPQKLVPGRVTFELYPDVSDYPSESLVPTGLGKLGNGEPSRLFSSIDPAVVATHFRWLQEYNLDGVVLQQFLTEYLNPTLNQARRQIATLVRENAERTQKAFYLMYDISGATEKFDELLLHDLDAYAAGELGLVSSPQYVHARGKPVIGVWGLGFYGRPGTAKQSLRLIKALKERGYYVVGGISFYWRRDSEKDKKEWLKTFLELDRIVPWSVSAIKTVDEVKKKYEEVVDEDLKFLAEQRRLREASRLGETIRLPERSEGSPDYQVVIYPGFSWSNWNKGKRNFIPRRGGKFMWRQAEEAKSRNLGAFIAMFDEYDEGTAVAKAAPDRSQIPKRQYFLTLDADGEKLPSDFYLRLTEKITKYLQKE